MQALADVVDEPVPSVQSLWQRKAELVKKRTVDPKERR